MEKEGQTITHHAAPIAIIGIGGMFPQARNLQEYWTLLKEGRDAITDIPATHWKPADYFDRDQKARDKTYGAKGGFLPPIEFDPLEFGIVPNALEATDTSQLLSLVVAQEALRDAGYLQREFDRDRASVILGVTGAQELVISLGARLGHPHWRKALQDAGVADDIAQDVIERIRQQYVEWQENSFPGLLGNVIAGRIANRFDFGGTNCVVDAACASSLSAVHLAMLELQHGKADLVLSGGVDAFNDIFMYMCFSKTPALSPSGHARPFDQNCDGTTLGEGIGLVVLKRLADAQRDGDKIYAVLRGIGSSSDGKGTSIYAPKAEGQVKAYRNAYRDARVAPDTIELLEAHGTGTAVGDAMEIKGLIEFFTPQMNGAKCALGSVKSQIGHAKSAAGIAGLIKVALALYHKTLPPTIKVEKPTAALESDKTPFYVNTQKRVWPMPENHPRRAALSAFGFGGTNFHCVLEEFAPRKPHPDWTGETQLLALSAPDLPALQAALDDINLSQSWDDLRRMAARARRKFDAKQAHRLVIVVERGQSDLAKLLKNARIMLEKNQGKASWNTPDGIFYGSGTPGKLGVIFPGQGAQFVGMLRDMACQFPEFQDVLNAANHMFGTEFAQQRLSDLMYPQPVFSDAEREQQAAALQTTQVAQPAIGAASLGAYHVLKTFGLAPDAVAGHSYGELVALCVAGVLDIETFFAMSKLRGELMGQKRGDKGSMLAVNGDLKFVAEFIKNEKIDLVIANKNAPLQIVLSGATSEVERAASLLKARDIRCKQLSVAAAFHSSFVADASGAFLEALRRVTIAAPQIAVYADSTAQLYPSDAAEIRRLLAEQLANPVDFLSIIENMYASGVRAFFEVGPSAQMNGLIKAILEGKPVEVFSLDAGKGQRSGEADLARALGQLAVLGYDIRLAQWDGAAVAEDESAAPKNRRMTVTLCGANYFKPKPPKPPVTMPVQAESAPVNKPEMSVKTPAASMANAPVNPPKPKTAQPAATAPVPPKTPTPPSIPASRPSNGLPASDALRMTQENLRTLQQFQQQTADLHRQFLEGQDATRQTFERLFSQQQQLILGNAAPQIPLSQPQPAMPTPVFETKTPPAAAPSAPVAAPHPVQAEPVVAPTAAQPQPAPAQNRVAEVVMAVVAEKTGYPPDMLELDMGLDADLGIDSIKRVEILSALQEKLPGAPEISSQQIGAIRTLRQVVDLLGKGAEIAQPAPQAAAPAIEISASNAPQIEAVLLEVVAEKTGYPEDMLDLEMGLDADLGIDSIKRVEIFSALQHKLPGTPEISSAQIGAIRTLRQVVEMFGASAAQPSNGNGSRPKPPAIQAEATPDVANILLEVVAEKTGYPEDMLDLEMGLDADLGIDSIKRVEIFSALQNKLPGAPEISSDQIGRLSKLRQIVDLFSVSGKTSFPQPAMTRHQPLPAGIDAKHAESVLLQVVAEKTGYPAEMLDLDMALDADLGIDSIKRVEIFSALQTHLPGTPEITSDQIGRLRNLRQIIGALARPAVTISPMIGALTPNDIPTEIPDEPEPAAAPAETLDRYVVLPVKLPDRPAAQAISLTPGATILLTDDGSAVTDALENGLRQRGFQPKRIAWDSADLRLPEQLGGLILIAPVNQADSVLLKQAFRLTQAAGNALQASPSLFATVSRLDGKFGFGYLAPETAVFSGGLAGLTKTVAREWPSAQCKAIDLAPEVTADRLLEELFSRSPLEVGLAPDGRFTLQIEETPLSGAAPSQAGIGKNDVIVITGGARGVTAECAAALAEAVQPTLILVGRSPLPGDEPAWLSHANGDAAIKQAIMANATRKMTPKEVGEECQRVLMNREMRANLRRIERAGARVAYRSVDVRDAAAVRRLVDDAQREFGAITGLIHGAGVLADRRIEKKTETQFESVVSTKLDGAVNFLNALAANPLKCMVFFSSTTARFGRIGQADYAMANETLNKLAQREARRRPDCRVVALNWGPWAGGMVTPVLEKLFAQENIRLIPLQDGAAQLVNELSSSEAVEVLILGKGSVLPQPEDAPHSDLAVTFERTVTVDSHPFLRSHVMNGRAVLPTAMMMEWMAHAALHNHPGLALHGFDDFRVLKGVILEQNAAITLCALVGDARKEGKIFYAPVELQSADASGKWRRHAQATVLLSAKLPQGERRIDESGLRLAPYSNGDIYQHCLFHGADLRGIQRVEGCSASGIAATAKAAPAPSAWMQTPLRNHWLADPLMLDSSFQLLIVWSCAEYQAGSLPSFIGKYRQFAPKFPADGGRIAARIAQHDRHRAVADIEFLDRNGGLLARIEGYECAIDAALNAAFRRNTLEG